MPPKDISLSAEERRAFDRLFDNADTEQLGVLTGDKAVPFFEASELPGQVLGEIWALADDENTGFLTKEAFYVVCRLIGYAQRGQQPSTALMKKSGPLPFFKGMHVPGLPEQPPSATPVGTPQKKATATSAPGMTITPDDKAKYTRLFYNSHPVNGLLDGEKARDIFTKSRLPNEKLGQIWNLADTQSQGALDATDFVIAMHLIHGSMNGTIPQLPDTLPVSVYAQAAAGVTSSIPSMPTSPIRAQVTGMSSPSALYAQPTGSSLLNRTSAGSGVLSPAQRAMPLGQSQGGGNWAIDAMEKAQSDQFFDMLDTSRQGVLQGEVAVPFFVQSGLPEETLAQIWDLSDIRKEGSLTKEEFAVARRLVMDVLAGKPLPDQLEQSMVPPGLRAIAQQMQNQPQQSEVQRDLFSLMDDDEPSQLPPAAIASGASAFQPQPAGARVASPAPIQPTPTGGSSRSIPQPLQPVRSGTSSRQDSFHHRSPPPPVPAHRTHSTHPASPTHSNTPSHGFFDTTPVEEKGNQISSHSAEVGNLQNQVRETQKSVSSLRQERTALSGNVAKTEAEIDELKSALAQAKAAYDTESTNMTNLETRFKTGSEELKKLRQELIHAESELSALREQKVETEQNILKDKEEIRELKIKLKVSNDEVAALKETLEKLRKEARQQKGLVVVSKKQLATSESDKEKIAKSISEERENARAVHTPSPSATEAAHAIPLPDSKGASPAASTHSGRSMNPFFAHTGAARVTSPLQASTLPTNQDPEADPFGMAPQAVQAPNPQAPAPAQATGFGGFDDDFNAAFNPVVTSGPTSEEKGKGRALEVETGPTQNRGDTDFDAAFADFDKPIAGSTTEATPASRDVSAAEPAGSLASTAHEDDIHKSSDQETSTADQVTNITGSAAVGAAVGALAGAGAAAVSQIQDVFTADKTHDEPVASPSSMQPYDSRQLPEEAHVEAEDDNDVDGSSELAPIRDVEQDDTESDSDSDSETDEGVTRGANQAMDDAAGPFASVEDEPDEHESLGASGPPVIADEASDVAPASQQADVHPGESLSSDPFPGAFPTGRGSRPPSSVGEGDEHFEDAHTEQHERSASPTADGPVSMFPASAAGTDTSNETEPLKSPAAVMLEGAPIKSTDASKPGPTLGFDDSFDSPFKAMTPASNDSPVPVRPAEEASSATAAPAVMIPAYSEPASIPAYGEPAAPAETAARTKESDDFDDFEDLAPARVEDTSASAAISAPTSTRNPDFEGTFEDDFGFDNQTFSHSNAQQTASHSRDGGSSAFDDNFDSAFDAPAVPSHTGTTIQPPALPSRAPAVGFDDDFFSSPTEPVQPASHHQDQVPQYQQSAVSHSDSHAMGRGSRSSYDNPPAGDPPAGAGHSDITVNQGFAPPSGPPPPSTQQQQQQPIANTSVPALPNRTGTETDGDLPQVKELVGMGFNRRQAIAALEDNQFDLERAANALLSVNN